MTPVTPYKGEGGLCIRRRYANHTSAHRSRPWTDSVRFLERERDVSRSCPLLQEGLGHCVAINAAARIFPSVQVFVRRTLGHQPCLMSRWTTWGSVEFAGGGDTPREAAFCAPVSRRAAGRHADKTSRAGVAKDSTLSAEGCRMTILLPRVRCIVVSASCWEWFGALIRKDGDTRGSDEKDG
jgi:hypothetical protein